MKNIITFPQSPKMGKRPPKRLPNSSRRTREYLTQEEVAAMIAAAKKSPRHGERDAALILLAFRHGLRVAELCALRWEQVNLKAGWLYVRRVKRGIPATHPLRGPEIRSLRAIARAYPDHGGYVFVSERRGPLTAASVYKIVAKAGKEAGLPFPVHPHMLRHATGFYLANRGLDTRAIQLYLGHKNIQHTVRYTELSPNRFAGFFED